MGFFDYVSSGFSSVINEAMEKNYEKARKMDVDSLRYTIKGEDRSRKHLYILALAGRGMVDEAADFCREFEIDSKVFVKYLQCEKVEGVALKLIKILDGESY